MQTGNHNVLVSVIIPVYNAEEYLELCLKGLVNQTLHEAEFICVDDGSTDHSYQILEKFAQIDTRFVLAQQQNKGAGPARNLGLSLASGRFVAFMDADDLYPSDDTLAHLSQAAIEHEAKVVAGTLLELKQDGSVTAVSNPLSHLVEQGFANKFVAYSNFQFDFNYQCYLFDRQMLLENNIVFPDYRRFQDPPFFVNALTAAGSFYLLAEPSYCYRVGHQNVKWDKRKITDLLKGHLDILLLSKKMNYEKLHSNTINRLDNRYAELVTKIYNWNSVDLFGLVLHIQNAADFELYNKTLPPSRQITELNIVERMSAKASALLEARCHDYTCVELHALLLELISSLKGYGVDELQTKYAALRILAHCFTWERSSAMRKLLCSYLESPEFSSLDLDSLSYDECPSSVRQAFDVLRAVKPAYEFRAKLDLSAEDKHCKCVAESSVAQSPKVSVIIPVYNVENYLPKCLDSVLQQTLQEIEIVCVSDGSPDGSLEILMDYAKRYPNLKVLTQENGGLSVARNNGLKYANGEYIHFLDSDDTMELGAYEFLYSTAAEQDLDLLFFDANSVYETEDLKQAYPWYLHGYHSQKESDQVQSGSQYYINAVNDKTFRLSACMYIVRREFLLQAGITFQEGITHEDNYFTNAVSTLSSRTSHVSIPFYNRLVHEGSLTIQDIQFRHCYGYFASFLAMQHFIYTKLEDPKLVAAAQIKMSEMLQHAKENYDRISDPAQKYFYLTLPEQELSSFYTLIILPQNISENALLLRERLTETFKEKSEINAKLQLTYKEKFDRGVTIKEQKAKLKEQKAIIKEQKTQLKQLKAEKKALQQELNALKTKHGKLKKSLSYRIGRYLTWPFRKLKALFSKK